ncbi:hypothetical protein PCANC_08392 [Puccinia coronata f. sp. avenae]|uniref:F-box domain-containing protein n=1 Tax=Puccinia coronata f. sp. avenae TaxID=200324 RepID=A0A2N5V6L1_9BASI|nr:hypothetical protein PCANC_08392 [Puccinia coronata f. sp. avenae]
METILPHDEACFVEQQQLQQTRVGALCSKLYSSNPSTTRVDFLGHLPTELALFILLKLTSNPVDLLVCTLVNTHWRSLARDNLVWKDAFTQRTHWKITPTHTRAATTTTTHSIPPFARRLSQLIAHTSPHDYHDDHLNWLNLFRDRFILDARWKNGTQISKKLKGHKDSIYCLQMHDHHIITGSRDRTIKVWDTRTRECTKTLVGHKGSVLCVRVDSEVLLSGSSDTHVCVWDRQTWTVVKELVGHQSGVLDLAISPAAFVSCSKDTTIKIWSRPNGTLLRTITGHAGPVNALELSQSSLAELLGNNSSNDSNSSSSSTSLALLSASGDSSMKLWELDTGALIRSFDGHLRGLACLKLVELSRQIITGSNDETIKIWNLLNGQCLQTLLAHSGLVRSLDFSLPHNRLVSGSYDKTIKVWDLTTGQLLLDFRRGAERNLVFDIKFNLTTIVSVGHSNSIMLLDFADGLDAERFI